MLNCCSIDLQDNVRLEQLYILFPCLKQETQKAAFRKHFFVAGVSKFAQNISSINGVILAKLFILQSVSARFLSHTELSVNFLKKKLQLPYYFWAHHRFLILLRNAGLVLLDSCTYMGSAFTVIVSEVCLSLVSIWHPLIIHDPLQTCV